MNCQNIAEILDDGDSRGLSAAARRELDTHLAGCAECRAAFAMHEAMGAMAVPAMSPRLAELCRSAVVAQSAARTRRAGGRPFVVVGLLLAGAAAAAFVGFNVIGGSGGDAELSEVVVDAPDPDEDPNELAGIPFAGPDEANAGPGEPAVVASDGTGFTVGMAPLRQLSANAQVIQSSEVVYRAFLDELRRIPDLELVMLAPGEFEANDFRADIVRLVEGAETAVAAPVPTPNPGSFAINGPPGEVIEFEPVSVDLATAPSLLVKRMEVVSGGASAGASADTASGVVNVTLDDHIEGVRVDLSYSTTDEGHGATLPPDPLPYDYLVQVTSSNPGPGAPWQFIVNGLSRSGSTFSASVGTNTSGLLDAAEFLAPVIAGLQEQLFPVDEATLAAIEQRVLDTSLAHVDRMREFGRLKRMSERAGRTQLSDDVALAGVDIFMSASNDWERQTLLTSLTGVDNAVVVQPLSNILRNDANEATRLQAALALTAFDQDVYARAALETAANVDPSAAVRQNARWGLLDAAGRRNLIIASLLDTRLSDAERIEPLLFQGNWLNEPPVQLGSAIDATLVNELTALLRREERESTRLSIVGNFTSSSNPALTPLFIELLAEDESVVIRRLAVEALGLRRDEPGVSSVIARAAAEDPSPIVRASAARAPDAGN